MGNEDLQFDEQQDAGVIKLVSELKHVEAPKDFDVRVRARIAQGRPSEKMSSRWPAWAYAAPLALVIAIGGYFGVNSFYSTSDANVPAIAETITPVAPQTISQEDRVVTAPETTTGSTQVAATKPDEKQTANIETVKRPSLVRNTSSGGSFDQASRIPRRIYQRQTASELLTEIGVQGTFESTGVKVESASTNGIAERSGLKQGDVIESVNDQPLTEKSSIKGRPAARTVRVKRDGKTIDLVLKN